MRVDSRLLHRTAGSGPRAFWTHSTQAYHLLLDTAACTRRDHQGASKGRRRITRRSITRGGTRKGPCIPEERENDSLLSPCEVRSGALEIGDRQDGIRDYTRPGARGGEGVAAVGRKARGFRRFASEFLLFTCSLQEVLGDQVTSCGRERERRERTHHLYEFVIVDLAVAVRVCLADHLVDFCVREFLAYRNRGRVWW